MNDVKQKLQRPVLRELVMYVLAAVCLVAAIVAVFLGMFIAPAGEVHGSVLTYFGISAAFCGSLLGISAHCSNELTRFKNDIIDSLTPKTLII